MAKRRLLTALMTAFVSGACLKAPPSPFNVRIRLVDETGAPTAARAGISSAAPSRPVALPASALRAKESTKNLADLSPREQRSALPKWNGWLPEDVDGTLTLSLPAGNYIVRAEKGTEYEPVVAALVVPSSGTVEASLTLRRFVDMPARGWWSGDDHVHVTRDSGWLSAGKISDKEIFAAAQAAGVHVVNALQMGDAAKVYFRQRAFGRRGRAKHGSHFIIPGQEDPRTHIRGHLLGLNAARFVRSKADYLLYDEISRGIRAAGGIAGYAHFRLHEKDAEGRRVPPGGGKPLEYAAWNEYGGASNADLGILLDLPEGTVDFIELLDGAGPLNPEGYYDFLNMGFRLPASAGSDFPYGDHIGDARVYAYLEPGAPFSTDAWFASLKAGRTFVTQGPLIEFTVNGTIPGAVFPEGTPLSVRIRVFGPSGGGRVKSAQLVVSGEVARELRADAAGGVDWTGTISLPRGGWLAARAKAEDGAAAHTSPVYVGIGPSATAHPAKAREVASRCLAALDLLDRRLSLVESMMPDARRADERLWLKSSAEFRRRIERAKRFYGDIAQVPPR